MKFTRRMLKTFLATALIVGVLGAFAQKERDPNAPDPVQVPPFTGDLRGANGTCFSTPTAIPDNDAGGLSTVISIPAGSGTLTDLNVSLNVTHTWVGDLIVTLEHGGTTVTLVDRIGLPDIGAFGCGEDDIIAVLDDDATDPIEGVCVMGQVPTVNGTFSPEQALSAFNGMDYSGDWTLNISDNAAQDTGTLNEWCLQPTFPCLITSMTLGDGGTSVNLDGNCAAGADIYRQDANGNVTLVQSGVVINGSVSIPVTFYPDSFFFAVDAGAAPDPGNIVAQTGRTVPTLQTWALIGFLALLAAAGVFFMRRARTA